MNVFILESELADSLCQKSFQNLEILIELVVNVRIICL